MTVTWNNVDKVAIVSGSTEASPDQLGNIYNAAVAGGGSSNVFAAGNTYQFSDMSILMQGGCLTIFPFQELFLNRSQFQWHNTAGGTLTLYYNSRLTFAGDSTTRYDSIGTNMLMNAAAKFKTVWFSDPGLNKPQVYIVNATTQSLLGARVSGSTVPSVTWDVNGLHIFLPTTATINFASSAASATLDDIEITDLNSTGGKVYFHKHTLNRTKFRNINQLGLIGNPGVGVGPTFVDPYFFFGSSRRLEFLTPAANPGLITFQDPTFLSGSWNGKFYNATDRIMWKNTIERRFVDEDSANVGPGVKAQYRSSNSTIGPQVDATSSSGLIAVTLISLDSAANTGNASVEITPTVVTWTEDYHPYLYNEGINSRVQSSQMLAGGSSTTINLRTVNYAMPSEASASALAGISVNHATQTITVTQANTYRNIFAYCKQNLRQAGNMQYADFIRTYDGKGFECDYNIIIDGAELSGEGWMMLTGAKTLTLSNGGGLGTGNFATDVNGTYGTGPGGGTTGLTIADIKTALTEQGYTTARALLLDNLDATVSSREAEEDAAARAATNQAEHDATQAAISSLDTATDNAAAVWDYLTVNSTLGGSFGMLIKTNLNGPISSLQTETSANTRYGSLLTQHANTQSLINGLDTQGDCQDALTAFGYTSARASLLDNVDVAVSTRESESAAATRAANNQSEHDATQAMIDGLTVTVDNGSIAAAVWDYLTSDSITAGTFGMLVKTNLDAAVSTRESEVSAASRANDNVTEHNETQNAIAELDFTSDVTGALTAQGYTAARAGKLDYLDGAISTLEAESSAATRFATLLNEHDATQAAVAAINVVTDVQTAMTNQGYTTGRAPKIDKLDNLNAAAPTSSEIVIAILDEALAGHDIAGSVGRALRLARDQSTVAAINTQQ